MTDRAALLGTACPPQIWRGVLAWSLGAAFYFYAFVHRVSPSIMVHELMRDFAASGAVVGYLSDRLGRRKRILIFCCFLLTVQLLAALYVPTLPLAVLSALLLGIGFAARRWA